MAVVVTAVMVVVVAAGTESVLVLLAGVQSVTTFQILYLVIAIV